MMAQHQTRRRTSAISLIVGLVAAVTTLAVPTADANDVVSTEDITPPSVESVELDVTSVDVVDGAETITATIRATDDLSGVEQVTLTYRHRTRSNAITIFAYGPRRVSGDGLDGIYEAGVVIGSATAAGDYDLESLYARDTVGNHFRAYDSTLPPPTITVISEVDVTAPVIESLTADNLNIDVSADLAIVGFEAVVTDDVSGVFSLSLGFRSPSGRQHAFASLRPTPSEPTVLSGSAVVAGFSEAGQWQLDTVCVRDLVQNSQCWNRWTDPTASDRFGLALNVTSDFADNTPPSMDSYDVDPLDIDVTLEQKRVSVDFNVRDDRAGVAYAFLTFASPRTVGASPEVIFRTAWVHAPALWTYRYQDGRWEIERTSNEPLLDGTIQGHVWFPRYDRSGDWEIKQVCVVDHTNWSTCYAGEDLIGLGPSTLGVEWNRTPNVAVTGVDEERYPASAQPEVGCEVSDLEDGAIEGVAPQIAGPDTDNVVTISCSYTDSGGVTGSDTASYVIENETDSIPPTLSGSPTADPNDAGWYNGPVVIAWTAADADSGIDPSTIPADSEISGEGTGLTVDASVSDLAGNVVTATSAPAVSIDQTAPLVDDVTLGSNPVELGTSTDLSAVVSDNLSGVVAAEYFVDTDPGAGSGIAMTVDSGRVSAVLEAGSTGVYTVYVRAADAAGNWSAAAPLMLVVYDPSGGFVTGGGWIDSPAGSSVADPTAAGKANFGFVAKYNKGADVPEGHTEFHFRAGNLRFRSVAYDWLVVTGNSARYKGVGELNGEPGYGFMLTACDSEASGSCSGLGADSFGLHIWRLGDEATVYDNGSTALAGGSIKVHRS